jgi:hypothetical protein
VFHKLGSVGRQGTAGRSTSSPIGLLSHSSNRTSGLKILLETDDTNRTLSCGEGRLSPRGSVDERCLGESPMLKRVSGTRSRERSESAQSKSPSDSGAAMVEMAFIFGILMMLLVGVVTSAIALGHKNSIENAAREASRYAATLPEAWDNLNEVVSVAIGAAQGNLDADVPGQYICVAHTGQNQMLVVQGGVVTGPSNGQCYDDGLSDSRVQVRTGRESQIHAALFSIDLNLNATASARYERAGT